MAGEDRTEDASAESEPAEPAPPRSGASARARVPEAPITFSEFAMSVGMNAMAMLDTEGDLVPAKADLLQAAQHIDILRMLKDKTRGNLDESEQKLLESLIYDLQMRYLEVARAQS